MECAPTCEPTCRFPDVHCDESCEDRVCRCKEGYIRSEQEGPCIPASACPPMPTDFDVYSLMPTCDGVVCDEGTHCEIVDLACIDGYCPQEAVCVDDF
ncbi:unnamed protein product [Strongylus vulgaris]|uniref:TIL domain-containing protein n=1 Tax=Strongylus vulgaris TaxID=40348 RepID=A0A3P7IB51_STRVU|nr:unnamed protein product [Strongylus vulgaris]